MPACHVSEHHIPVYIDITRYDTTSSRGIPSSSNMHIHAIMPGEAQLPVSKCWCMYGTHIYALQSSQPISCTQTASFLNSPQPTIQTYLCMCLSHLWYVNVELHPKSRQNKQVATMQNTMDECTNTENTCIALCPAALYSRTLDMCCFPPAMFHKLSPSDHHM